MPNKKLILTDYEAKKRPKQQKQGLKGQNNEFSTDADVSALEHYELDGFMVREFTIHILQSIHYLQNMDPIPEDEVLAR